VPNGVSPPARAGDAAAARGRTGAGERRIALCVASDLPHKNLPALLAGLAELPRGERPLTVFAGHGTATGGLPARARELGVEEDVRLLGAVAPVELEDLYAAAAVVVTVTRYEGFGLPVLEAMIRGVPVACSALPVLREVAGPNGAIWLDPDEPASVAAALRSALAGGPEVERLRAAGAERATRFSWRAAAERTAECYERALAAARQNRER
jgi:glycosyltransferase involved in cell wall biosynthesis